jgi:isobutyryl-CoA dehydrogenase
MIRLTFRNFSLVNRLNFLPEEHLLIQEAALQFGKEHIQPYVQQWDEDHYFPRKEVLEKSAELGMGFGGIFTSEEYGGSNMGRLAGSVIFEALAYSCPTMAANMSIQNMNGTILDQYGSDW